MRFARPRSAILNDLPRSPHPTRDAGSARAGSAGGNLGVGCVEAPARTPTRERAGGSCQGAGKAGFVPGPIQARRCQKIDKALGVERVAILDDYER